MLSPEDSKFVEELGQRPVSDWGIALTSLEAQQIFAIIRNLEGQLTYERDAKEAYKENMLRQEKALEKCKEQRDYLYSGSLFARETIEAKNKELSEILKE